MVDMFRVSGFMYMSNPPHGMLILDLQAGGNPISTPTPAPAFSVQPTITGTPQVGVSSVGNPGTASNTTSHTYRWLLSVTSGGTYTAISGATAATYTPVSGDETKYLKFEDTAIGAGGSTVATSAFAGPVSAASAIDTPILANLSTGWTTGQNPPAWQSSYPNVQGYSAGSGTGDQLRVRWRLAAGTWNVTAYEPLDTELATGTAVPWAFLTDGSLNAGGVFDVQEMITRDLGLGTEQSSNWSSSWTDTLSAVASSLPMNFRSSNMQAAGFSSYTAFTGLTTYTGKKHVIMLLASNSVPATVTLDGNAMTKKVDIVSGAFSIGVWECTIATGGTGKSLTVAGSGDALAYSLWTTDSTATYVSSTSTGYGFTPDPQVTPSLTMPSLGAIIGGCLGGNTVSSVDSPGVQDAAAGPFGGNIYYSWFGRLTATGSISLNGLPYSGTILLAASYQP